MEFTHERRADTDVFRTTDPAGHELANGAGEGGRVVSASTIPISHRVNSLRAGQAQGDWP